MTERMYHLISENHISNSEQTFQYASVLFDYLFIKCIQKGILGENPNLQLAINTVCCMCLSAKLHSSHTFRLSDLQVYVDSLDVTIDQIQREELKVFLEQKTWDFPIANQYLSKHGAVQLSGYVLNDVTKLNSLSQFHPDIAVPIQDTVPTGVSDDTPNPLTMLTGDNMKGYRDLVCITSMYLYRPYSDLIPKNELTDRTVYDKMVQVVSNPKDYNVPNELIDLCKNVHDKIPVHGI